MTNILLAPIAVVAAASGLSFVLQVVMQIALGVTGWVTAFAASCAAATGIAGFCYFCLTELGKKGVEHLVTPRV